MLLKAIKLAKEWQSATQVPKKPTASSKDCNSSISQTHLPINAFNLFSDAAWNSSSYAGGLGWVIKNPTGSTLLQGSSSRRVGASALSAEALALKEGLTKAILAGIKDLVCFQTLDV